MMTCVFLSRLRARFANRDQGEYGRHKTCRPQNFDSRNFENHNMFPRRSLAGSG
jgi:hypothetical protein